MSPPTTIPPNSRKPTTIPPTTTPPTTTPPNSRKPTTIPPTTTPPTTTPATTTPATTTPPTTPGPGSTQIPVTSSYNSGVNTAPKIYIWSSFKKIKDKNPKEMACIYPKYEDLAIIDFYRGKLTDSYNTKEVIEAVGEGLFIDLYNKLHQSDYKAYIYKDPFYIHDIRVNTNWLLLDDLERILGDQQIPYLVRGKMENIEDNDIERFLEEHKNLSIKFYSTAINLGKLAPMIFFNSLNIKPNITVPAPAPPVRIKNGDTTISTKRLKKALGGVGEASLIDKEKFILAKVKNTIDLVFPKELATTDSEIEDRIKAIKILNINIPKEKKEIINLNNFITDKYINDPQIKFEIASLADTHHVTQHSLRKVYRKAICLRIEERIK